jgi:hypothetical protein
VGATILSGPSRRKERLRPAGNCGRASDIGATGMAFDYTSRVGKYKPVGDGAAAPQGT